MGFVSCFVFLMSYLSGFGCWAPCSGTCSPDAVFWGCSAPGSPQGKRRCPRFTCWRAGAGAGEPAREIQLHSGGFIIMQIAFLRLLSHSNVNCVRAAGVAAPCPSAPPGEGRCLCACCYLGFSPLGKACCPMSVTWLISLFDSWKPGPSTLSKAVGVWVFFFF